jgi:hypothetical protein
MLGLNSRFIDNIYIVVGIFFIKEIAPKRFDFNLQAFYIITIQVIKL